MNNGQRKRDVGFPHNSFEGGARKDTSWNSTMVPKNPHITK